MAVLAQADNPSPARTATSAERSLLLLNRVMLTVSSPVMILAGMGVLRRRVRDTGK
jgi:hypothetical protein